MRWPFSGVKVAPTKVSKACVFWMVTEADPSVTGTGPPIGEPFLVNCTMPDGGVVLNGASTSAVHVTVSYCFMGLVDDESDTRVAPSGLNRVMVWPAELGSVDNHIVPSNPDVSNRNPCPTAPPESGAVKECWEPSVPICRRLRAAP